jgi:hypothetical protein
MRIQLLPISELQLPNNLPVIMKLSMETDCTRQFEKLVEGVPFDEFATDIRVIDNGGVQIYKARNKPSSADRRRRNIRSHCI